MPKLFYLTPQAPDTFSFSGTVHLEGQEEHSGVTVALYYLAELDTAVQRMQKEFPFVGVPISQQTEFDHRLAEPAYQTKTARDGSYRIDNIKGDSYNLAAFKNGYGWRYVYEINGTATKENLTQIELYPETEVQGQLDQYTVWPKNRHHIVKSYITIPSRTLVSAFSLQVHLPAFFIMLARDAACREN